MRKLHNKPPLGRVAAKKKTKNTYAINLKQLYGLRKEIYALRISVNKLHDHIVKCHGGCCL